jgi:hypothetical protein
MTIDQSDIRRLNLVCLDNRAVRASSQEAPGGFFMWFNRTRQIPEGASHTGISIGELLLCAYFWQKIG